MAFVDARYRTLARPESRAITGKSSGGYGAMITPMLRPDVFGALASHAGDSLHELCYIPDFPKAVRALRAYDGDIHAWWTDFQSRIAFTKPDDGLLLMMWGIAACFSADPDGTPVLPFDPRTGQLIDDVWQRWLDADPVRMAPRYAGALAGLRAVWLDAGKSDEHYLDLGTQAFRDAVVAAGLPEDRLHFELFEGVTAGSTTAIPSPWSGWPTGWPADEGRGSSPCPPPRPPVAGACHRTPRGPPTCRGPSAPRPERGAGWPGPGGRCWLTGRSRR